jgi:hypothetical protein
VFRHREDQAAAPDGKTPGADKMHVVIATPLGEHGKGGVDRIMDVIRSYAGAHPDPAFALHFLTTRGKGSILWSPAYLASAALRLIWLKATGRADVLHVNIGKRGSALRKLVLCSLARRLGLPYVLHLHGSEFSIYWDSVGPSLSARLEAAFNRGRGSRSSRTPPGRRAHRRAIGRRRRRRTSCSSARSDRARACPNSSQPWPPCRGTAPGGRPWPATARWIKPAAMSHASASPKR